MTKMRWATLLAGMWIAGTIIVSVVASENFYTIDHLLAEMPNPAFRAGVERLGHADARVLLRYLSSELNRLYFQLWNLMQMIIGLAMLRLLWRSGVSRAVHWTVTAMLAVVVLMFLWLAPAITTVGRGLDFVPRDPAPPALGRFGILHAVYVTLEVAKGLAGFVVASLLVRFDGVEESKCQEQP